MKKTLQHFIKIRFHIFSISSTIIGFWILSTFFGLISCKKKEQLSYLNHVEPLLEVELYTPSLVKGIPYEFNGIVQAQEEHLFSFKTGGVIHYVHSENIPISKGDILASINSTELVNNLIKIKSSLNDINHDLQKLYELQKDSIGPLYKIEKLEVKKQIQESNYSSALYNKRNSIITAPFNGYISKQIKKKGEVTQPTAPILVYKSFFKNISFYVPQEIISHISLQQEISFNVNGETNQTYKGQINAVALSPSPNGLYEIKATCNENVTVKDGFMVSITLKLHTDKENGMLPLRFVDKIIKKDSIKVYVIEQQKAKKIIIPFKKSHDDGFIISKAYCHYQFIEIFNALEEGIIIRKSK